MTRGEGGVAIVSSGSDVPASHTQSILPGSWPASPPPSTGLPPSSRPNPTHSEDSL